MTRRRRGRGRVHPAVWAAAALVALAMLPYLAYALRALVVLALLGGGVALAAVAVSRGTGRGRASAAEASALRIQLAHARAELAEALGARDAAQDEARAAHASAAAAWDAAAEVTPRCRFCRRPLDSDGECPAACDDYPPPRRGDLLADPRSGARPLIGGTGE